MLSDNILEYYKQTLFKRFDDELGFYFNVNDFMGLCEEPYEFKSFKGVTLRGNFYHYDSYRENHIVVFDHGMGAGYTAYFREIELLARYGYLVYSYDHTGCMKSDGECAEGFLTSLADLDSCLTALKRDYPNHKISVIGHSWGGFSTSNIATYHPDVAHVISFAPFNSLSSILHQTFHGLLGFMYKHAYKLECQYNGEYAESSAVEALKNYQGHALIIHSKDDNVLNVKYHFNKIKKALESNNNIEFLLVDKKLHNPNYTTDAVALLSEFARERRKVAKKYKTLTEEEHNLFINSFDWWAITEQDLDIWERVFDILEK